MKKNTYNGLTIHKEAVAITRMVVADHDVIQGNHPIHLVNYWDIMNITSIEILIKFSEDDGRVFIARGRIKIERENILLGR